MLKRKLYKASFISASFMCIAVSFGNRPIFLKNTEIIDLSPSTSMHHFDSSGLCTCIPFTTKDELADAPRIQLHKNAAPFVKSYSKKNGFFLDKLKLKKSKYFSILDSVLCQAELPVELKYLAFVESGLQLNAGSSSGAIGPWALMPKAAKQYGLNIYGKNDERLNYYKSTKAAAGLLTDLYAKYGDWLLVIAAYNCGPGGIQKAIKLSGSRNYWTLQKFLPEETKKHVLKFIAVHYHFEGHGSVTTLTKEATEAHIKAVEIYVQKQTERGMAEQGDEGG
jgi:membrane-bound lytic murein transglycosylase D